MLARKIRSGVNKDIIGGHVTGMRKTRTGGLLIEVREDQAQVETVRAEVARSVGTDIGVRSLLRRDLIEIRDLDEWATKEEVVEALAAFSEDNGEASLKVVSLRKQYGGVQAALVLSLLEISRKVLKDG